MDNFKKALVAAAFLLLMLYLILFGHDRQSVEQLVKQGNQKYKNGDWNGAITDYSSIIKLRPRSYAAYANRGHAESMLNRLDDATFDLNRAIEINPKIDFAYEDRGWVKYAKNDLSGAISDYQEAIALNHTNSSAYWGLALAEGEKGDLKGAVSYFDEYIQLVPTDAPFISTI